LLALLFPGQGAQRVGMGRDVYETSPAARAVFDAADDALGLPLSRLCFEGPEESLLATEMQQPAILATSVALLRALEERSGCALPAAYVAGHSLGEYSALVASGSLALPDAVRLVRARGAYMQDAVPAGAGAMAAILGADARAVEGACARARERSGSWVEPANYNAPGQTVISGAAAAVDAACEEARQAGARRATRLAVSAPFHCRLMAPAAERLAGDLERLDFADPVPPLIANVSAEVVREGGRIGELLRRQVTEPVRFTAMVQALAALGGTRVLEIGPAKVLSALVARIEPGLARTALTGAAELDAAAAFATGGAEFPPAS
jgi:[acyl-carrier-protein] S-malonyltransferase